MKTEEAVLEMMVNSIQHNTYNLREEMHYGRRYIVVPVVMMREGVHCGSRGPIYHAPEELARFVEAWNGRPITIQHPEQDGVSVSASQSPQLAERAVGKIYNTRYQDGLKAEAWLDIEKLQNTSIEALAYIRQGRPLDVSVGVFTDEEPTQGEWNGEQYESIARNYRPDHLALLPGATGACSWADGCGIRNNKEGGNMNELLKTFKEMAAKGYAVSLISNEQGYQELLQLLSSKLDSMDNDERIYFLEEVYDNYIVYRVRTREGSGSTLYKWNYTITGNEVTLGENPVEVRKEVSYVTMEMKRTKNVSINKNEGGTKMSDKLCCEAKVDALIANKATKFTSQDREWLLTQDESVIDKMEPVVEKPVEAPAVNEAEVITTFKSTLKTIEDYAALMPEDMREQFTNGVKLYNEHREELVKSIMDNTEKDLWAEDDLTAMETAQLEKLAKSVTKSDYSGQAGGTVQGNAAGEAPLLPPGVETK